MRRAEKSAFAAPHYRGEKADNAAKNQYPPNKLRACCFGRLTLSYGGQYLILKNKKAKELVAFLLCERGRPVRKSKLAEVLWPDASPQSAMSSLYKVCRYIREFPANGGGAIPITESRGEIWLDMADVSCDLTEFEKYYADKDDIMSCASAVELYEAQLFYDESYEWVSQWEAFFDIRNIELLETLVSYYTRLGNRQTAEYYKNKIEG